MACHIHGIRRTGHPPPRVDGGGATGRALNATEPKAPCATTQSITDKELRSDHARKSGSMPGRCWEQWPKRQHLAGALEQTRDHPRTSGIPSRQPPHGKQMRRLQDNPRRRVADGAATSMKNAAEHPHDGGAEGAETPGEEGEPREPLELQEEEGGVVIGLEADPVKEGKEGEKRKRVATSSRAEEKVWRSTCSSQL